MKHSGLEMGPRRERPPLATSTYDFEALSPDLQEKVEAFARDLETKYPPTREIMSRAFNMNGIRFSTPQVQYFKAFTHLSIRQLIIGDMLGVVERNNETRGIQSEEQLHTHLTDGTVNTLLLGTDIYHDVMHSFVECAKHPEDVSLSVLTPAFQRKLQRPMAPEDRTDEDRAIRHELSNDEDFVQYWDVGTGMSRGKILRWAEEERSRFIVGKHNSRLFGEVRRPINAALAARIHDTYKNNPWLLWDVFVESTLPFMKVHAPKEAAALTKGK